MHGKAKASVQYVARALLTAVLSVAGFGKLYALTVMPNQQDWPSLVVALSLVELWCAGLLWSRRESRKLVAWFSCFLLALGFTTYFFGKLLAGSGTNDCNCLGVFSGAVSHFWLLTIYLSALTLSFPKLSNSWALLKAEIEISRIFTECIWFSAAVLGIYLALVPPFGREFVGLTQLPVVFVNCESSKCGHVDLGDVKKGSSTVCSVKLMNVLNSPVRVLGQRASCSCTPIDDLPHEFEPDRPYEIQFSYTAKGKIGVAQSHVDIYLGTAWHHAVRVNFQANILDSIE